MILLVTYVAVAYAVVAYAGVNYLTANQDEENALFDSLTALSLLIAFCYALTGIACAIYYRRHLLESGENLLLIGVGVFLTGIVVMLILRGVDGEYWCERPGVADPELARATVPDSKES